MTLLRSLPSVSEKLKNSMSSDHEISFSLYPPSITQLLLWGSRLSSFISVVCDTICRPVICRDFWCLVFITVIEILSEQPHQNAPSFNKCHLNCVIIKKVILLICILELKHVRASIPSSFHLHSLWPCRL